MYDRRTDSLKDINKNMNDCSNLSTAVTVKEYIKSILKRDNKPNILLLMTDQQRFDTINAAGFEFMKTPNLDRLVREGCMFNYAYSPNPICCPARHNMITGLPARYHTISDNDFNARCPGALPTVAQILSDNGYDTSAIGKMHFQPARRHNGFDKLQLCEEVPNYREDDEYAMYLKSVGLGNIQNIHGVRNLLYMVPQRALIPEEYHSTTWVADRSIEFIKTNNGRRPFFLFTSWIAPHPPFDVPETFADMYNGVDIPEPYVSKTPLSPLSEENKKLGDHPNKNYLRRMRALYYSAITQIDKNIGRILETLEKTGQLDNTLIIFTTDHGEMLGDHGLYQKWLPYDSCCRIPFIVRYPSRIKGGTICNDFVDLNDILPTILDAAGLEYPGEIELPGESVLTDKKVKERSFQYVEYSKGNRRWISIRNKEYKYNYYYGGGREELFDMINDPYETTNLLFKEESREITKVKNELRKKLVEYEKRYGLEGYVVHDDFIRLQSYVPRPSRNIAYPVFPMTLSEEERSTMNDFYEEIVKVVEKEPIVDLSELDLDAWKNNRNIPEDIVRKVLEGDRKNKAAIKNNINR